MYIEIIRTQKIKLDKLFKKSHGENNKIVGCRVYEKDGRSNIFYCSATRPWTSTCISNLYYNIKSDWSAERTARETNRDIQEVIFMTAFLKIYGYDKVYTGLLRKELNFDVSNEIRFLQKLGITT